MESNSTAFLIKKNCATALAGHRAAILFNSNLDSSKVKSTAFTANVDSYSQIAIRVPNKTILFAVTNTYMLVPQNTSGDFRVFGPLAYKKLDPVSEKTVITGTVYYI